MKTAMDIPDKEGRKRLVIVGGGFGGLKLARKLKSDKYQIVLLDKNNHHIFNLYFIRWLRQVLNRVPFPFPTAKSLRKESISIYVFVKHNALCRKITYWRLPLVRWLMTIW